MQYDILRQSIVAKALPILLLAISASFLGSDRATARQYPWPDSAEVTVMTPDSLELVGNLYWPKSTKLTKLPLVVLLHQTAETHGAWKHLVDVLCASDFAVFAMDLRGCGYSIYDFRTGQNRPPNTFYIGERARYPADIRQLVKKLFTERGKMLDSTRIAVVGAELGGNVGMLYAVDEPSVRFTALISPGLEYSGLQIGKAIKDYGERPLFMATAKLDIYSMESLDLLSDVVPRLLDAVVFDTYRYGNALVDTEPQLVRMLTDRLRKYLK
jgi:alpha-beta hydrolase superfamily lysophospholipase